MEFRLRLRRSPPQAGLESGSARSENHRLTKLPGLLSGETTNHMFQYSYSCLTYSDALTYSEVFRFYLRRQTKFRRNILMDIFVNTHLMKPHTVMGSFLYEEY